MTDLTALDIKAIEQRRERARQMVDDLCEGRREWIMRIPAEPDHDPDLIIAASLMDIPKLIAALDAAGHVTHATAPEGFAILPREPTKEMIDKAEDALEEHKDSDWDSGADGDGHNTREYYTSGAARDMYLAAIAAAPNAKNPPQPEG